MVEDLRSVFTVIVLAITAFHIGNFSAGAGKDSGFAPFGLKGIFSAIASGGVIFAYLGFEQAIQLGGESKNPRRNIPLAVIGSMVLGVILYIEAPRTVESTDPSRDSEAQRRELDEALKILDQDGVPATAIQAFGNPGRDHRRR